MSAGLAFSAAPPASGALVGLAAARPAASLANKGVMYYATDTGVATLSDGGAWQPVVPGSTGFALEGLASARPPASAANKGQSYFATDTLVTTISDGTTWQPIPAAVSASSMTLISQSPPLVVPSTTLADFTNIPQTYNHLRLIIQGAQSSAGDQYAALRGNGLAAGYCYTGQILTTVATMSDDFSTPAGVIGILAGSGQSASDATQIVVDIAGYTSTIFDKVAVAHSTSARNPNPRGATYFTNFPTTMLGLTRLEVIIYFASSNWIAGSWAALYGVI